MKNNDIIIEKKNIKHMYLKVLPPEGHVKVSAPYHISNSEIMDFIASKIDWINEKKKLISKNSPPQNTYQNGEIHYLWGEKYNLQLILKKDIKTAFILDETLYLPVSRNNSISSREKALNNFYREELKRKITEIYDECILKVNRTPQKVKIRKMKNWGNCNQKGIITLNLNLAKKDPICLKYVFIHELCHLIEFNHGTNFKKLMDEHCPNWRKIKKILNEN